MIEPTDYELDQMAQGLERSIALDALSKDDLILLVISRERELYQHTLPTVAYQEWPWYGKLVCYAAFLFFAGAMYVYGRCS